MNVPSEASGWAGEEAEVAGAEEVAAEVAEVAAVGGAMGRNGLTIRRQGFPSRIPSS